MQSDRSDALHTKISYRVTYKDIRESWYELQNKVMGSLTPNLYYRAAHDFIL